MTLKEFVNNNGADFSFNRISEEKLCEIEEKVGVVFGVQLKSYVLEYGYLGYKHAELFGINNHQGVNSDMVEETLRLHKNFEQTKNLVAVEDQGEGDYYLVDSKDLVYRFVRSNNVLIPQNIDLFEYILTRFTSI